LPSPAGSYSIPEDGNATIVPTEKGERIFLNRPTGKMFPLPHTPDGLGGGMAPQVIEERYVAIQKPGDGLQWQKVDYDGNPIGGPLSPDGLVYPLGPGAHVAILNPR
jgi:hypothetical protein